MHIALTVFLALAMAVPALASTCAAVKDLNLSSTTISIAESVPAGSFTPPGAEKPFLNLPAFCRVAGVIRPSIDSEILFEVWMPASGWNGRFYGFGNGGFAGSISFGQMASAVSLSYATASTDTGHQAGTVDASWAAGHPEKIVDFGYRAIHETAVTAKAVIAAFYDRGARHSYFSACSNGGRQALMEAQRYPEDYDGIIAGAPAYNWTHLMSGAVWGMRATLENKASYIPHSKLPALQAAILASCDGLDGLKDGVLDDPRRCSFNPSKLLCKAVDSDSCLTAPQVTAIKTLYSGLRAGNGKQIEDGLLPGAEAWRGSWPEWITGKERGKSIMAGFGQQFFSNMVFNNAAWDYRTFEVNRDLRLANEKVANILSAVDPDLKRFQKRGGKLVLYHGWNDPAIPATGTIRYYDSVVANTGSKDATDFLRLYMVPGMLHCNGGPGANTFGQFGPPQSDPRRDLAAAVERWVEQGVPPDRITATKYKNDDRADDIVATRPICPWPQVAKWTGIGSSSDAINFVCKAN
ncbi:MAG: tannase/feruloyl esterase family alpha/beta hydrolase [Bryobacteraceae bacterium]|nr:tannase/feruloyl esterase family alpha/beta hydrolase [Bryobacteraceae bacterium]